MTWPRVGVHEDVGLRLLGVRRGGRRARDDDGGERREHERQREEPPPQAAEQRHAAPRVGEPTASRRIPDPFLLRCAIGRLRSGGTANDSGWPAAACHDGARDLRTPCLTPHRGHRRVRDPRGRRQGEGAQGRRRAGHRLRRRRARLPDPGPHRRGRGRGLPEPGEPPVLARRPAFPTFGPRLPRRPHATPGTSATPPRCSSPTAGSTRSTTRSRRCSTPATRCCCPRRTGPPTRRRSRSPAGNRSRCRPTEATGFRVTVDQLEGGAHHEHEGAAVRLAVEPDRRGVPAGRGRGDRRVGGRARHLGRHRRDLRAPDLRRAPVHVDADARPRARRDVRRAQRRREDLRDDGLARRLDDRAARRDRRGHEPAVAVDVERRERLASAPRSPRSAATSKRSRRCGTRSRARGLTMHAVLAGIPGVECMQPEGAFYCFPNFDAVLDREYAGRKVTTTTELAEVLLDEVRVAIVPGEAFGAPGYAPALVRARRRRPRRGRPPHRRFLGVTGSRVTSDQWVEPR